MGRQVQEELRGSTQSSPGGVCMPQGFRYSGSDRVGPAEKSGPGVGGHVQEEIRRLAEQIAEQNAKWLEGFIRRELVRLISECIQSGDFVHYIGPANGHDVVYLPYHEADRLRKRLRLVEENLPPDVLTNLQEKGIFMLVD